MLAKADRMRLSAEGLLRDGFIESAASRAYYVEFHAIQALLKSIDQTYSKHSGVIGPFHRELIKTGPLPSEFGMALTRLAKHRDIGDYNYLWTLDTDQVTEDVRMAKEMLGAIRRHLGLDLESG